MKPGDKVLLTKKIDEKDYIVLEVHKDTVTIQENYFYSQYECEIKTVPIDEVALLTPENITKYWENRETNDINFDFNKVSLYSNKVNNYNLDDDEKYRIWTDPDYVYEGKEIEFPKPFTEEDYTRNEEFFKEEAELVKKNLELEEESNRKNGIKSIDEKFLGFLLVNM